MIHELLPTMFSDPGGIAVAKRRWCERADVILAISQATKRDLLELIPVDPERIVVTPLGVQVAQPSRAPAFDRLYFLYVGARRGYKNFQLALKALAQLSGPDAPSLIAFGGPPLSDDELRLIVELRLLGRVLWRSGDDASLAAHYRDAVALVFPSLYEGFGLPLVEAMAAGCPVVAAATAALKETGGDAALFFDPLEVDDLTTAMRRMMSDVALRDQSRTKGLARAGIFTWKRTIDVTIGAYRSLY